MNSIEQNMMTSKRLVMLLRNLSWQGRWYFRITYRWCFDVDIGYSHTSCVKTQFIYSSWGSFQVQSCMLSFVKPFPPLIQLHLYRCQRKWQKLKTRIAWFNCKLIKLSSTTQSKSDWVTTNVDRTKSKNGHHQIHVDRNVWLVSHLMRMRKHTNDKYNFNLLAAQFLNKIIGHLGS